jgi:hypothetical protein
MHDVTRRFERIRPASVRQVLLGDEYVAELAQPSVALDEPVIEWTPFLTPSAIDDRRLPASDTETAASGPVAETESNRRRA